MSPWEIELLGLESLLNPENKGEPRALGRKESYLGPNYTARPRSYMGDRQYGAYTPARDIIDYNPKLNSYPGSLAQTLAHEGQHRQYARTKEGKNPRLTKQQYEELLAGYYFDQKTGEKKRTYTPGSIGYSGAMTGHGKDTFPHRVWEQHQKQGLLSQDFLSGNNGFLANFAGIEGGLPANRRLEDMEVFNQQFPSKEGRDWYYRTSFPETNWLKESDYPFKKKNKSSLLDEIIKMLGF